MRETYREKVRKSTYGYYRGGECLIHGTKFDPNCIECRVVKKTRGNMSKPAAEEAEVG